ncbi:MAG TPA: hypothetical protein VN034_00710 [Sphingopyxis sp.]|nr:hypothetical protein [Sphingopyxis sp.]
MSANWGLLDPNAYRRGFEQSQDMFDQVRKEQVRKATGSALQDLMADPNGRPRSLNALAMLAPDTASQLIKFQQGQQDRSRDTEYRSALSDYYGAGGGNSMNALMPRPMRPSTPTSNIAPPPISDAPPPPADWEARLGPGGLDQLPAMSGTPHRMGNPAQPITHIDPNSVAADPYAAQGIGAESGVAGQVAPGAEETGLPMPPEIARAAQSPDMNVRNAAFKRMMQLNPIEAMKIQSSERDRHLDGMEDANKAFRFAAEALGNARDDATYKQVLDRVEQAVAPLGIDIRSMVPGTHPGPDGIRELQMQALDISQRFAAIDRRFSAEARVADIEADNERADRNTNSIIEDRQARTGIARDRAATSDRREARIAAGGGGRGKGGGKAPVKIRQGEAVAAGPGGAKMVVRGGKWVPAQ